MISKIDKKNSLWNSSIFVIMSLLGFLSFSLNIKSFEASIFGLFILINSIFGIGSNLDFGFGVSTVKHIAEAQKKEDRELLNYIFTSFLLVFVCLSLLIAFLFLAYYLLFLKNDELINSLESYGVKIIFLFLTLTFISRYISNFLNRVFDGLGQFILVAKINLFVAILNTIFMVVIYVYKLEIIYLSIFVFSSSIILFLTLFYFSANFVHFKIKYFNFGLVKKYALYSINLQLSFFMNSLIDPITKFIIGNLLGLNFVTYFETGKKIIDLSNGLIVSAQKAVLNKISEVNLVGKLNQFVNEELFIYSKMSNYYSIIAYGILSPMLCLFIFFWFKSYEAMIIFLIFTLPYTLINFGGCLYAVFMIEGRGIRLFIIQSINLLMTSVFLFFSIAIFKNYLGLVGFYLATIASIGIIFYFLKKSNSLDILRYLKASHFTDIIIMSVFLLFELILLYNFKEQFVLILFVFWIVYLLVFLKYVKFAFSILYNKLKKFKNITSLFKTAPLK